MLAGGFGSVIIRATQVVAAARQLAIAMMQSVRLRFDPDDIVLTTVVEHHANLLPWGRVAQRRYVEQLNSGEPARLVPPISANRAWTFGPARPALISLLSLSITSTGVFLGAPMPNQVLAS